jgi:hypothetical protein
MVVSARVAEGDLPRDSRTAPGWITIFHLASARAFGFERNAGPLREGPALLQGRVVCGLCGNRMHVHYDIRRKGVMMLFSRLLLPSRIYQ